MKPSDDQPEKSNALRALGFDGSFSPTNALSELLILDEVGGRWAYDTEQDDENVRPAEMFDIICGTGIGGFYAVLFAALNLTIGQAIQVHQLLNDSIFNSAAWLNKDQEVCLAVASQALDGMAEELGIKIPLDQPFAQSAFTKAFVCIVNNSSAGSCRLLRNYRSRIRSPSCTIREALLVCLSDRIHIPPTRICGEHFLNGIDGFANPTRTLLKELPNAFPKALEVSCLVSIGAGHPGILPLMKEDFEETAALLRSCELVAEDVAAQCHDLDSFFFRFSISSSTDTQESNDLDFTSLVKGLTAGYLDSAEATTRIDHLVEALQQRQGIIALKRLSSLAGEDGRSQLTAKVAKVQQHLDDSVFRDFNNWLKPIHHTSKLDSNNRAREATTCQWILANSTFIQWMAAQGGLFWFHGLMGTGKTVMSSFIIQTLLDREDIYIAYYYFEFTNPSTLSEEALFCSLVAQLAVASATVTRALYQKHNNGGLQPQLKTLRTTLKELVSASSKPVFIVIDALDELPLPQRKYLVQTLLTFCSPDGASQTHIMLTSREEVDILRALEKKVDFELGVQGDLVRQDIAAFVDMQLGDEKADGQFRVVACQVDILQQVKNSRQLQESLYFLPKGLGDTYNHILENIPVELRELAHRLFAILSFASESISIEELSAMLAVESNEKEESHDLPEFQESNLFHDPLEVIDLGTCLVSRVVDHGSTYLQLAHASVKEHMLASRSCWFSLNEDLAHDIIASTVLALLLHFRIFQRGVDDKTLHRYSRNNWYTHILPSGSPHVLQLQKQLYASFPWRFKPYGRRHTPSSSLASAVSHGLFDLVQALLNSNPWDVDTLTNALVWGASLSPGQRETHYCLEQRRIQCCDLLISHGAQINAIANGSVALSEAASSFSVRFVRFLVDKGADVNGTGGKYDAPLQAAAYRGSLDVVQYLVEMGADVNKVGGEYGTALQAAAYKMSLEVVQYLVEQGADVNIIGGKHKTALDAVKANWWPSQEIEQNLKSHGAKSYEELGTKNE
ncbi:hypothetical protein DL96DRAFT_1811948 [Flagelloscypha sp. PMI_526]|nr:hypothetical protein DL96DRAFT_1811948 [Flagelloscypha sp. PMI_526]